MFYRASNTRLKQRVEKLLNEKRGLKDEVELLSNQKQKERVEARKKCGGVNHTVTALVVGSVAQLLQGRAGIVSNNDGDSGGGGGIEVGGVAADPELMSKARESLLAAFEEVFGMELVHRGGPPSV